jgi:hypothetical protein
VKASLSAFQDELPGWALRVGLCAFPSFFLAIVVGFNQLGEIAGMVLGVAAWVVLISAACAWLLQSGSAGWTRAVRALEVAVVIKFLTMLLGWLVVFLLKGSIAPGLANLLGYFLNLDMALGMAALWLVGQIAGADIEKLNSFGWTTLTTVVEGALMTAVIGAMALVILGWWRWGGFKAPVRSSGCGRVG